MANRPRAKGRVVYETGEQPEVVAAVKHLKQLDTERRIKAAERREAPMPNWKRYPLMFAGLVDDNGNWLGKGKLPCCPKCKAFVSPRETGHADRCDYVPKYPEYDREMREARQSEQREAIHNHRQEMWEENHEYVDEQKEQDDWEQRTVECSRCGEEIHGMDDPHECD